MALSAGTVFTFAARGVQAMYRRQFVGGVVAFALCGVTVFEADSASSASRPEAHVYLLRGLMGMSLGLDELSEKLKQRGINATVHELGEASALAADAARNYNSGREREIILIGHSFGGAAILTMAEELGRAGVP